MSNTPFHKPQQHATIENYASEIVKLLLFLMRKQHSINLSLGVELQAKLDLLKQKLIARADGTVGESVLSDVVPGLIHSIFMLLWKQAWNPTAGSQFPDPTMVYVALSTLKPAGNWDCNSVTHPLAALTFIMRCAFKNEIIFQAGDSSINAVHTSTLNLQQWFVEKNHTPFNAVCALQHLASSIVFSTPKMPRVWWLGKPGDHKAMRLDGMKIEIDKLRVTLHQLQKSMVETWDIEVLMGTGLTVNHEDLADDLGNKTPGYSCISDVRNNLAASHDALMESILNNKTLFNEFVIKCDDGHLEWNIIKLHAWLRSLANFELDSMACTEFLTGGVARGTELEAMTYCNTVTRQRNLFVIGNFVSHVRMYTKTGAMTGDRLLPATYDACNASLMISKLALVRPFAQFAARICFPGQPEIADLYGTHLYMDYKTPMKSERLSKRMMEITNSGLGCEIGIRLWRQASAAMRRALTSRAWDMLEKEDEMVDLGSMQFGHSRRTDLQHYGVTVAGAVGAEDVLGGMLYLSCDWHVEMQVVPGASKHSSFVTRTDKINTIYRP
jgi:hypothetical protein